MSLLVLPCSCAHTWRAAHLDAILELMHHTPGSDVRVERAHKRIHIIGSFTMLGHQQVVEQCFCRAAPYCAVGGAVQVELVHFAIIFGRATARLRAASFRPFPFF